MTFCLVGVAEVIGSMERSVVPPWIFSMENTSGFSQNSCNRVALSNVTTPLSRSITDRMLPSVTSEFPLSWNFVRTLLSHGGMLL